MIFFVTRDGKQIDEYEKHEFHSKIFAKTILTTDYYWIEGMDDWRPVSEYTIGMQTMKMDLTPSAPPEPTTKKPAAAPSDALAKVTNWLRRPR